MKLSNPPIHDKNLLGRVWSLWFQTLKDLLVKEETVTGTVTLNPVGASRIDSSDGAVTATLGDGEFVGQIKTIVMVDASNSSTVSVTNHETSDPEIFTFDAVDELLVLSWAGTEWATVKESCSH